MVIWRDGLSCASAGADSVSNGSSTKACIDRFMASSSPVNLA
jgi:hypothetical protein